MIFKTIKVNTIYFLFYYNC